MKILFLLLSFTCYFSSAADEVYIDFWGKDKNKPKAEIKITLEPKATPEAPIVKSPERPIGGRSYITDEVIPYLYEKEEDDPEDNQPFFGLGLGDDFLGNGNLHPGFTIPTGAVWQPRLWFYGTSRTSLGTYDLGENSPQTSEWATRLDLFGNLQLTGTERILVGVTPFHRDNDFLGQVLDPTESKESTNPTNLRVRTLFLEGDLAELFPKFDPLDSKGLDIGFSIGRQSVLFQDGMLINDTIDALGLTKNNIRFNENAWLTNLRVTTIWGFNEINRDDNEKSDDAQLFGLFTAMDTIWSTFEADAIYVDTEDEDAGDLFVWGLSSTKRIHEHYNWTVRYLGSNAVDDETDVSSDGHLLFTEVSWTPKGTHDVMYINGFAGIDNYTSASRDELAGGPLGRTGTLFAARGVGDYPSPLSNRAQQALGAAIGYQYFFDNKTQHLILETGFRRDTTNNSPDFVALGAQWQKSFGKRYLIQLDSFIRGEEDGEAGYGVRTEFQVKF